MDARSKWIIAAPESSDDEGTAEGSGDETGGGPAVGMDPNDPGRLRARTAVLVAELLGALSKKGQQRLIDIFRSFDVRLMASDGLGWPLIASDGL